MPWSKFFRERFIELGLFAIAGLCLCFVTLRNATTEGRFTLGPRAPGDLRVVTWNVGTGVDAGTRALRRKDFRRVGDVLEDLEPDIVFLQELTSVRQLDHLLERLGSHWRSSARALDSGRAIAVLARLGTLTELSEFDVPRAHAVEFSRPGGANVLCVVAHADAFNAESRNDTIGKATTFLNGHRDSKVTLFAGDLNLDLGLDQRGDLFSDDEYLDVETYNFVADGRVDVGVGSGSTAEPDRRLDYIFVEAGEFETIQAGPWRGQRSPGMDHHPLVADLRGTRD